MPSQRLILGSGLAILLVIGAASICLEMKSRSDARWVNQTLQALAKLSDLRLLVRRAESAARGFALTDDPNLVTEYNDAKSEIAPALLDLKQTTADSPVARQLLDGVEPLVAWRLESIDELIRLTLLKDPVAI